jgi:hypothetical protein
LKRGREVIEKKKRGEHFGETNFNIIFLFLM